MTQGEDIDYDIILDELIKRKTGCDTIARFQSLPKQLTGIFAAITSRRNFNSPTE
jgi:hypothetical protein